MGANLAESFNHRYHSEVAALQVAAAYACVRFLADIGAMLPMKVYRKSESERSEAPNHPNYRLLHKRANPLMTAFRWRSVTIAHWALYGNAYSLKVFSDVDPGRVVALWPLDPSRMEVDSNGIDVTYRYTPKVGPKKTWTSKEIFHWAGFSLDGYRGISPVKTCCNSIGLALTTDEFVGRFFGNGAWPGLVVEVPGDLDDEQFKDLKETIESVHQGSSKAFKVMILDNGMKATKIEIDAQRFQLIEARQHAIEDICRIWRVPPHIIQHLLRSTNNNIEHQGVEVSKFTVHPMAESLEQEIDAQLFTEADQEAGYYTEMNLDAVERGSLETRVNAHVAQVQNGLLTINEARSQDNRNPVQFGDTPRQQMQMVPLSDKPPQTTNGAQK